jgi:serine/threonine protein kinase
MLCVAAATAVLLLPSQREIKILADLGDGHLNIVHADEVLLTRTHVGLVMEYVSGGCPTAALKSCVVVICAVWW